MGSESNHAKRFMIRSDCNTGEPGLMDVHTLHSLSCAQEVKDLQTASEILGFTAPWVVASVASYWKAILASARRSPPHQNQDPEHSEGTHSSTV